MSNLQETLSSGLVLLFWLGPALVALSAVLQAVLRSLEHTIVPDRDLHALHHVAPMRRR